MLMSPINRKFSKPLSNGSSKRIIRLLQTGSIRSEEEQRIYFFAWYKKKWNPYCIRHSAITYDSDYLPEYALKKKVRWSMIKTRLKIHKKTHGKWAEGTDTDPEWYCPSWTDKKKTISSRISTVHIYQYCRKQVLFKIQLSPFVFSIYRN